MSNFIGHTLWVAQALPTANTTTAFEALTWVQVKGIITLPVLGITHNGIDIPDLALGFTQSVKGAGAGKDSTFTYREIAADAGQIDVAEQCADSAGLGSVKIAQGTGTVGADGPAVETGDVVTYAQGYFHTRDPNPGTDSDYKGFTASFRQNAIELTGTEPA